jgi:hypothetical protein
MADTENWDWETGQKAIPLNDWRQQYRWVEEPQVSPDGQYVAAIVNAAEGEFYVCVNGQTWERPFEKAWNLRFAPDGRLAALVMEEGEWTVAVDGVPWDNKFGYVWNLLFSEDGHHIAVAVQQDMRYGMALDDTPWEQTYSNLSNATLGAGGTTTAASVQVEDFGAAEIYKFQEGAFSAALNGNTWGAKFVNVWKVIISPDEENLAAEVRTTLYDYTIAVNGTPWDKTYSCVWEPIFHPQKGTVLAPVRTAGIWSLAENGEVIWDRSFV